MTLLLMLVSLSSTYHFGFRSTFPMIQIYADHTHNYAHPK